MQKEKEKDKRVLLAFRGKRVGGTNMQTGLDQDIKHSVTQLCATAWKSVRVKKQNKSKNPKFMWHT